MTRDGKWKPETDAWTHTCQKIIRDPSQTANKLLTLTLQKNLCTQELLPNPFAHF